jgi:hypothetical protein
MFESPCTLKKSALPEIFFLDTFYASNSKRAVITAGISR